MESIVIAGTIVTLAKGPAVAKAVSKAVGPAVTTTIGKVAAPIIDKANTLIDKVKNIGNTPLYRVMSQELDAIIANGYKFSINDFAMEQKWFATTQANAAQWGNLFYKNDAYRMIEIKLPTNLLNQMYYSSKLDGIGPAYCGEVEFLNSIMKGLRIIK